MAAVDDTARLLLDRMLQVFEALDLRPATRSRLDGDRLRQGEGAVLKVARAAELLPIASADAREWMHRRGLVRHLGPNRSEVVVWCDVLSALRHDTEASQCLSNSPRRRRGPPAV